MKNNRNNQIMLILYFIVVIFLLIQLYELYSIKNEHFYVTDSKKVPNVNIQSIILSPYEDEDAPLLYFGTFIKNSDKDALINSLYLYKTNSLKSPTWDRVENENMLLEKNKKVIITDISFDKSKRMIVIGLYYKNKKSIYNIYRKETENLNSKWNRISTDINIRSICHDINNDNNILGISSYDGQIYTNKGDYMNWVGPINYDGDVPLRKVMYTMNEGIMMGIGLFNNNIYIKEGGDWKNTVWKTKEKLPSGKIKTVPINNAKVRDLIYSKSGELIATTSTGIMIQDGVGAGFPFISIDTHNNTNKDIDISQIFKSKLGFEIDNTNIFTDHPVDEKVRQKAKDAYDFKKNVLDFCAKRKFVKNNENSSNEHDEINLKNKTINELYAQIEVINNDMSK
jgi:hypothetical protein